MIYDRSVDMWALGVTVYAMLCGELPFHAEENHEARCSLSEVLFASESRNEISGDGE